MPPATAVDETAPTLLIVNMRFSRLQLWGWRQLGTVDIDLSQRLTVLTGENGAGKTSILNLFGQHFQWHQEFLAVPGRNRDGQRTFRTNAGRRIVRRMISNHRQSYEESGVEIGRLDYDSGDPASLVVPANQASIAYSVGIYGQQEVDGLFITSHRAASYYQEVESLPPSFGTIQSILTEYVDVVRSRTSRYATQHKKSPLLLMKEVLLAAAIFGEGNTSVMRSPDALKVWTGFQDVLRSLLPASLKFEHLIAEPPEVILVTGTGRFAIDAMSGGLSALFDLAWQIFLRSHEKSAFTVCIDEPENHLHPSLQRSVMPQLLEAFPSVSFVVATHSPFIVTSWPDAAVYVMQHGPKGVDTEMLNFRQKAASAEETLRRVLGVPSTLPVWAENRFNEIMRRYLVVDPTVDSLRNLRRELVDAGLGDELSVAIDQIADGQRVVDDSLEER